jgi:hypothetical protein
MLVLQIVAFVAGLAIVAWVLETAIRTVVLPRRADVLMTAIIFRSVGAIFVWFANRRKRYEDLDRILALQAPVTLITLVITWLVLVLFGFSLMFWAVDPDAGYGAAFKLSGSSLTTLGFADAGTVVEQVLAFTVAGMGLMLLTLLITFLPSIYGAFSRREAKVALLEVRAGSPPTAVEFLIRYHRIGWLDRLGDEWEEWEAWFADIEESHTTYPALPFFRSPQPDRHWVIAAGTVLDAASISASTVRDVPRAPAGLVIRSGYIALRRIASAYGIRYNPDPSPTDPVSITRQEFDAAYDQLAESGVPLLDDRDQAWLDYAGWRVNYDSVLLALAEMLHPPYAPWTSDRSTTDHLRPHLPSIRRARRD